MNRRTSPEPSPLVRFGKRIRDVRMHRGLSQEQLAAKAERHWTYVGSVERGRRNVTLTTIVALAKALGVEPAQLLSRERPEGMAEAPSGKVRPGGRKKKSAGR
jgi:transcriptional regulator with XRE-family HTH domain